MQIVDFEKVRKYKKKDFLKTFHKYRSFLQYLNDPQLTYPTIIITGSTGKGTTAILVSEILTAHKYKVGVYTSPHLVKPLERIKINNRNISQKEMDLYERQVFRSLSSYNRNNKNSYKPTFFELYTIIAFLFFRNKHVDFAVLEVGIGGKLDATNMSTPVLNFILQVCREHTDFLGNSRKKILKEKQEVIKSDSTTVTLINHKNLLRILSKKCSKVNSSLYSINRHFKVQYKVIKDNMVHFIYKVQDQKT
ncbi:MAG: hypothetical protein KKH98_07610, partial [Spirochaetes bacterium]|nr:hypothetical protein [Spirochaetota bacterium]